MLQSASRKWLGVCTAGSVFNSQSVLETKTMFSASGISAIETDTLTATDGFAVSILGKNYIVLNQNLDRKRRMFAALRSFGELAFSSAITTPVPFILLSKPEIETVLKHYSVSENLFAKANATLFCSEIYAINALVSDEEIIRMLADTNLSAQKELSDIPKSAIIIKLISIDLSFHYAEEKEKERTAALIEKYAGGFGDKFFDWAVKKLT